MGPWWSVQHPVSGMFSLEGAQTPYSLSLFLLIAIYSPYWRCYYSNTDAIIYVVDSCDRERLSVSKDELVSMMQVELSFKLVDFGEPFSLIIMPSLPFLVFAFTGRGIEGCDTIGICKQTGARPHFYGNSLLEICPSLFVTFFSGYAKCHDSRRSVRGTWTGGSQK